MDAVMQHQWLNTKEESVWVLYREISFKTLLELLQFQASTSREKGIWLGQFALHLMMTLLGALKEEKLLVKKGKVT